MEWIELGDIISIRKGKKILETSNSENKVRMIMIEDLRNNNNLKYTEKNDKNVLVDKNDIVIAWDGANAGTIGYNLEGAIGSTLARLTIKPEDISSDYLGNFLRSKFREIRDNCTGATIPHISKKYLINLQIPVPPMETQKRIVEVLDKAQMLIDKRKEQIKLLDELIKSIFYDMFGDPVVNDKGWEVKKLKSMTSKIGSGATPKGGNSSYKDEGISLIRSMNVYDGKFSYNGLAFIDDNQAEKLSNVEVLEGDVLINITGASINRACIVPMEVLPARVNQHVSILRTIEGLNNYYLLYLLISKKFKQNLYNIATSGGATREAITKANLENLKILIPPIQLQNEFAKKVQLIESQKQLMEKSLKLMEDNYNSLMQRAFKGELF